MRAICLNSHGGTDMLEWRTDVPVPECGPRDVLVEVAAAAINNTDINTRVAWYSKHDADSADASWAGAPLDFPRIQGIDVCGRIAAVGSEVSGDRIGERVLVEPCLREYAGELRDPPWFLGSECDGGFAQYCVVPSRHAFAIDSELTDIELASFPCSYSTAENMLTRAGVGAGEHVLVTGASGGVGSAAVQLARARGADVTVVTSPEKAEGLLAIGAGRAIARGENPVNALGRNKVDVVIDLVAGPQWPQLLDVLKPGGRYAVSGAVGGPIVELDVRTLYLKDLSFYGCTALEDGVFAALVERIENGAIKPLVAAEFPLQEIVAAQEMFMTGSYTGKIVLRVSHQAS